MAKSRVQRFARIAGARFGAIAITVFAGGLLTVLMLRFSPGFLVDERELDPRLNQASRDAIEKERGAGRSVASLYGERLERMLLHADLGVSPSLNRPISQLLRERAPVTLKLMAIGLGGGWSLALALALPCVMWKSRVYRGFAGMLHQALMCLPAAALALIFFNFGGPIQLLVALAVCPRVFEYVRNLLADAYSQPHILTARAKGLRNLPILLRHVLPFAAPQMMALAGVSVSIAFGAAIPIEVLCDFAGIGQLAWKAAMARDLPLLITITFLVIVTTQLCSMVSDWAAMQEREA